MYTNTHRLFSHLYLQPHNNLVFLYLKRSCLQKHVHLLFCIQIIRCSPKIMANTAKTLMTNFIHAPPVLHFFLTNVMSIPVLYGKGYTILYRKVLHNPYIIVRDFFLQQVPKKNFSVSYTFILLLNDTNFYYKKSKETVFKWLSCKV